MSHKTTRSRWPRSERVSSCMIGQARADLEHFGLNCVFEIYIDGKRQHTAGLVGVCLFDETTIWVNPDQKSAALYRVVLHEIGHSLGLDHKRTGIMAPKRYGSADFQQRPPSKAQRRRWSLEIARLVLEYKARTWRKAA